MKFNFLKADEAGWRALCATVELIRRRGSNCKQERSADGLKTPDSWKVREIKFPLTPALSPGERECRQALATKFRFQATSTAKVVRAVGAGGLSLVLDYAGKLKELADKAVRAPWLGTPTSCTLCSRAPMALWFLLDFSAANGS